MKQKNSSGKGIMGILMASLAFFPAMGMFIPSIQAAEKAAIQKEAPAHVSYYAELRSKLADPNGPRHIILDQDVMVSGEGGSSNDIDINGRGREVIIDGGINKRKIYFSTRRSNENDNDIEVKEDGQEVTFKNLSFAYAGKNGAVIGGPKAKINFENVEAYGKKFINIGNPVLNLYGNIKARTEEQTIHSDNHFYINTGANVDVYSKKQHAIYTKYFDVNRNTHVKARNDAPDNAVVCLAGGGIAGFQSGSNIDFGINSGNSMALGSFFGKGRFTFYSSAIGTWDKSQVNNPDPTFHYPLDILPTTNDRMFILSGFGQAAWSLALQGPNSFIIQFTGGHGSNKSGSASNTGRIATGSFLPSNNKK